MSRIDDINKMTIPIEDINLGEIDDQMDKMEAETLKEIDDHIDNEERNAKEVYKNFDNMMAQGTANNEGKNLPEGWKMRYSMDNNFSQNQKNVPEGPKIKEKKGCSTRRSPEGWKHQESNRRGQKRTK